jgi:hypothetical protein
MNTTVQSVAEAHATFRPPPQGGKTSDRALLAGEGPIPTQILKVPGLGANLRLQDGVAQRLAGFRQRHGALSLETIDLKVLFEGDSISVPSNRAS